VGWPRVNSGLAWRGQVGLHRKALQQPDLDRLGLVFLAHTGGLAQHLGRAGACAAAAQGVGGQDAVRRTAQIALGDALDELRHIDAGGAGRLAGRVEAVVAALGLDQGLGGGEWRGVKCGRVHGRAPKWRANLTG
jgi:hypothetical protein